MGESQRAKILELAMVFVLLMKVIIFYCLLPLHAVSNINFNINK